MLVFDVVTLFPEMFAGPLAAGMLARARRDGRVAVRVHSLRRWGVGRHRLVDDQPYGGGGGMVLRPEPFFEAVDWIREQYPADRESIVLLSPQGPRLDDPGARRLAASGRLILLCGRYEGVDERVGSGLADRELSIGDYVLTGGELPALVVIDCVSRFVSGVLGQIGAADEESFATGRLESPYYTRPAEYRGHRVPDVLRSGDHGAIETWRSNRAEETTRAKRPDLLETHGCHDARGGRKEEEEEA